MEQKKMKEALSSCESELAMLYPDTGVARKRLSALIDAFGKKYGYDREVVLLSVPGRSEICGNHTDHNRGVAIAGAIDRDIAAVASRRDDGEINICSEGRDEDRITVNKTASPDDFPRYSSAALIAGVVNGFVRAGYKVGGFDAYTVTDVLPGCGLSSSAAFEVTVGNILNHLYNGGNVDNREIAKIAQYAENVYFGKPSGLMDQMACAVGGFVYMDFGVANSPLVVPIDFSLGSAGYSLCIVSTGGSHSELNEEYASIPGEMRAVAKALGQEVLSGITEENIMSALPALRGRVGDRAVLRALHFVRECSRVEAVRTALASGDIDGLISAMRESGHSSFEYLQNVYTNRNVNEQGLSLALALTEGYISGMRAACRVHGGGFEGTVQALMPTSATRGYISRMDKVFGEGSVMVLSVRRRGAVRIV